MAAVLWFLVFLAAVVALAMAFALRELHLTVRFNALLNRRENVALRQRVTELERRLATMAPALDHAEDLHPRPPQVSEGGRERDLERVD
jgi:hypothetical protein